MQATHTSANQSDGLRTQGGHGGNGETLHKSGIFNYKKKGKRWQQKNETFTSQAQDDEKIKNPIPLQMASLFRGI